MRETAESVARNPPTRAYANVRSATASMPRWTPPSSMVNEVNRQRMNAAVQHRRPNSRSHSQLSQAGPENHERSSQSKEYNCTVWPFVVRQALARNPEPFDEIDLA